ncbi:hypothetical protein KCU65_g3627, partial [Aureobasidium melanogenum]
MAACPVNGGEKGVHKPSFDKIHAADKSKKTWSSLDFDPDLVYALRTSGYKKPLPMQRVAITAVQEGVSTFISGGSGCAKTTAALIASVDLVMKNVTKMPRPHEMAPSDPCVPIVVMVVPSRDLAESAYTDLIGFVKKLDAGINNYIKPITVHGSIDRYENTRMLRSSKDANIIIGTPGRLADMIENNFISSANLRLLIFDQHFTLGGGSFRQAMHSIKDWAKGSSADPGVKTWSHPNVLATTDAIDPHRNTNVVKWPAPAGFIPQPINPRPRPDVPCMVLSEMVDLTEPRDAALLQHFVKNIITTKSTITIRFNENPLQDFHGTIDVYEVKRRFDKRGKKLLEDSQDMSGTENKRVLSVTFDRKKVQGYNKVMHKAGGQSEILKSDDKCQMWSKDASSSSDSSHLITASIGAVGNKWHDLDKLIITDLPSEKLVTFKENAEDVVDSYKGVFHYLVETIGRVGCSGREGQIKIYYDPKTDAYARKDLIKLLKLTRMPVADFLEDGFLAPPPSNNLGVALEATVKSAAEPAAESNPPTLDNDGAALTKEAAAEPDVTSNNLVMAPNISASPAGTWSFDTLEQAAHHGTTAAATDTAASAKVVPRTVSTQLSNERLKQMFLERLRRNQSRSRARGIYD